MPHVTSHRSGALGTGIFARLTGVMTTLFGAISNWNDARVTRTALNKLSDRELADIGICRGDIDKMFG
ncbi:MAG: DUF1127 domain-containing protein [Paracoccaceae bacterium]